MLDSYGIQRVPTPMKNPTANVVERVHQRLGVLLQDYELEYYKFPRGDPWSNLLAFATWAICSMIDMRLGVTPGQLAQSGREMLFDLVLKANWKDLEERKRVQIKGSNQHKMQSESYMNTRLAVHPYPIPRPSQYLQEAKG